MKVILIKEYLYLCVFKNANSRLWAGIQDVFDLIYSLRKPQMLTSGKYCWSVWWRWWNRRHYHDIIIIMIVVIVVIMVTMVMIVMVVMLMIVVMLLGTAWNEPWAWRKFRAAVRWWWRHGRGESDVVDRCHSSRREPHTRLSSVDVARHRRRYVVTSYAVT